ncbi:MAG: NAD(P)-dependent oxidoreductase [Candidatus Woesearchaeota archaeon]
MKIAFFEIKEWEKEFLNEEFKDDELHYFENSINEENCHEYKDFDVISVFIYSKVTKNVLDNLHNLKMVAARSTGFDHIDLNETKNRNIIVSNVPTYGENTVAEHTFALILNLARNVHKSYLRTTRDDFSIDGLEGFDLKDKTIGIIGTGNIGLHVIKIAKGFGMKVIAFDPMQKDFISEVLDFKYVDFDTLLNQSDIISIHAPLNDKTRHMINKDNIHKIKKGAILINTSRGGLVDTYALMDALDQKIISGAGLDVIEGEELIKEEKQLLYNNLDCEKMKTILTDHLIFKRENVVFTPHNAFNSREANKRILNTSIKNIKQFQVNEPVNVVQ